MKLKDYALAIQVCQNYCGPAATRGVLAYYGIELSQTQIAKAERTGKCYVGNGTAIFYFRDSTGRSPATEEVEANMILEDLESNDGYGSCAGNSNILR